MSRTGSGSPIADSEVTTLAVADRLQRVEDILEIQQLPIKYAIAVDERDIDGWLELFVPDVNVGRHGVGREALRQVITPMLRTFYRSIHHITGHRIDLLDATNATGSLYCRAEHEVGDRWIVIAIRYDDTYRKVDGRWHFARRNDKHWYETDLIERPQQVGFNGWADVSARPRLPEASRTWTGFWDGVDTGALTSTPLRPLSNRR
jgi:SnoaL-like domain